MKKFLYSLSGGYTFLPFYMAVNISNCCNRRCRFCPYHSRYLKETEHTRWVNNQPDFLDFDLFAGFLEKLGMYRKLITHIALTGKGEPLLHNKIFRFCHLLNGYKIPFTITTNGDFVTDNSLAFFVSLKYLTGIRVSLYSLQDVNKWLQRRLNYPDKVSLYNQTGRELEGIETGYTVQVEGAEKYCSMPKDFNKEPCSAPFSFMTVNTDGSVVPCYSYNEVGNISDPFLLVWNGKLMRRFRRDALRMKAEKSDCRNCGINLK